MRQRRREVRERKKHKNQRRNVLKKAETLRISMLSRECSSESEQIQRYPEHNKPGLHRELLYQQSARHSPARHGYLL